MPDAPTPIYDTAGNVVVGWSLRMDYDPILDKTVLSWRQEAGPYHRSASGRLDLDPLDPAACRDALLLRLSILSARRLF